MARTPSAVGETAAVVSVLTFLMWSANFVPKEAVIAIIAFGILFIIDWMLGGVSDKGMCKKLFD